MGFGDQYVPSDGDVLAKWNEKQVGRRPIAALLSSVIPAVSKGRPSELLFVPGRIQSRPHRTSRMDSDASPCLAMTAWGNVAYYLASRSTRVPGRS